jgi:hypothetical protein
MGLDAYVNIKFAGVDGEEETDELWYGRKENEIHGWMQRRSGVAPNNFNCVPFDLTAEILDDFEDAIKKGMLIPTSGFFFGSGNDVESVSIAANELLESARHALSEGDQPYYSSWW